MLLINAFNEKERNCFYSVCTLQYFIKRKCNLNNANEKTFCSSRYRLLMQQYRDQGLRPRSRQVYLISIIRPTSKFHFAILIVEREPCDINFTSWFEYSRRNICTATTACNHHICWIRSIKCFVRTTLAKWWKRRVIMSF